MSENSVEINIASGTIEEISNIPSSKFLTNILGSKFEKNHNFNPTNFGICQLTK